MAELSSLDINQIMRLLPHRYPFLLVDRVISYEPHRNLLAYKNVTYNEHFFQGHFPDKPVMPGVLIIEALGQAGGLLAYLSAGSEVEGRITYFMGIDKVKFRQPVEPGDRLDLKVELVRPGTKYWKLHGEARVGDKKVAEAELLAALL
ncbi:MAG: 3-hydroxyacyl-ACP dehydratase FabZ [Deltaproteobacteria bacterium]|nr:3-hydroxyacyl-ACP dehydratase FabZ [Deltaproteobacteria bacterium]